ncbi:MAG: hypothetical protein QM699_07970 [Amaricoccus sp.]|uniref:hypothetical protein n=1 Tax=Amaricoccus sp. TaxID=1872485 RepID=UPI0039E30B64
MRLAILLSLAGSLVAAAPAVAGSAFNYDDLGAEFCRLTTAGDLADLRPLLSRQLGAALDRVAGNPSLPPPALLFQTYATPVANCAARTVNAALVQITRSQPDGTGWMDYIVIVPEPDGQTRIDDVLFALRRSDTLMSRLQSLAGQG